MKPEHIDYHVLETTLHAGGVRLRNNWPAKVLLMCMLRWKADFRSACGRDHRDFYDNLEYESLIRRTVSRK
jgi:hypothetical protein